MKKNIFILLLIIFLSGIFFPLISDAALVPCGRSDQIGTPDEMCRLCHFIIGIKGLIDYGFTIMVIIGILMLVVSGIVYIVSTGNEGMMETAKSLMKSAIIGFAIILGAWLIVNTTLWVIGAKGNSDEGGALGIQVESWNKFSCTGN